MGRMLMILGASLFVTGLLWQFGSQWGLGKLPGDITIERENLSIHIPLMTSLLASLVLSFVFWLMRR